MELREVFEPIVNFIKNLQKKDKEATSKEKAKERLQLVLMQDRASVSPDFFEMMKKEIIDVIKKYIEIDEDALEVQLTRGFEDGEGGPALFANIPIKNIKPVAKKLEEKVEEFETKEKNEGKEEEKKVEIHETENKEATQEKDGEGEKKEQTEEVTADGKEKINQENVTEEEKNEDSEVEENSNQTEKKETSKKETKKKTQTKAKKTAKK